MKKTSLLLIMVLVAGIVFAMPCEGKEQSKMHDGMKGEMMMGRMMEALELTDVQKDKIETLTFEHKKQMIAAKAELKTLQLEKKEAMKDDDFAAAKKLNAKIFDTKEEIANARLELKENIMKELTAEQQEKAKELHKKAGRKMMKEHSKSAGKEKGKKMQNKHCQENSTEKGEPCEVKGKE